MKISERIESRKRRIAQQLTRVSERYSVTTKKRIVLISGFLLACICIGLMILPFQVTHKSKKAQMKEQMPVVIAPPLPEPLVSKQEYETMTAFLHTLDSLKRIDRSTYDHAMKGRQGLIDSVLFLIKHYGQTLIED